MSAEIFVNASVLYYANTDSANTRHALARQRLGELWEVQGRAAVSVQVLQELNVNLVRKANLPPKDSADRVQLHPAWQIVDNDRLLLAAAFDVQARWQLSFWDSLIVAAAQRSGAPVLWSEDLADRQRYGDVIVVNPLVRTTE